MSAVSDREAANGMEGDWECEGQGGQKIREDDVWIKNRVTKGASYAKNRGESTAGEESS